ncbi:hypothetical protein [Silvanigrella aquatica]|uniref:Uncharacterized protein n=1 Tax=Silvanigrella aquatica TaxID=1915309 RepID=A0A1L4CXA2_9BACT|nr:hypothetical protein [Silvanigrella aquatica]APJ02569.1 hypothetical protein AXG55_00920 [Silvanigrella aquatica]
MKLKIILMIFLLIVLSSFHKNLSNQGILNDKESVVRIPCHIHSDESECFSKHVSSVALNSSK